MNKQISVPIVYMNDQKKVVKVNVVRTMPNKCKTCKNNEARHGSAYCESCAKEYKNEH